MVPVNVAVEKSGLNRAAPPCVMRVTIAIQSEGVIRIEARRHWLMLVCARKISDDNCEVSG